MQRMLIFPSLRLKQEKTKEFNIKRHYDSKHTNFFKFMVYARKNKLSRPKNTLKQQNSVFQRQTTESQNNTFARRQHKSKKQEIVY